MKVNNRILQNQQNSCFIIGDWELPEGNILAPMAGITDSPFRRLCRSFGSGLLYTECISAEGVRRLGAKSLNFALFHEEERPIAIQLFGSEAQQFGDAAAIISERYKPDLIDINCGCPVRKMIRRNSGGYLMQFPDLIGRIVEAVVKASELPVSVKLRRGYNNSCDTAMIAATYAEEAGASLIAIHARYVRDSNETSADWDIIGRVKSAVGRIPVVGNGDVRCWSDALRMKTLTGCDRVMIGRGVFGRPWVFSPQENSNQCEPPPLEKIDILLRHYTSMLGHYPEQRAVYRMRKHIGWYTKGLPESARLRNDVMKLTCADDVKARILKFREYITSFTKDK